MAKIQRSSSVYDVQYKRKPSKSQIHQRILIRGTQLTFSIVLGVFLTIVTIALQCVAFFTPHWKEISPNTHSLYVDGVDALIRNEVLVYFNSVHRFTRHSYGLFQRCEYLLTNSSKLVGEYHNIDLHQQRKTCTKNFLPSYEDEQFNECHSLQYYRFCSKTSETHFDILNDYLRATFDILSKPGKTIDSPSSCDCHYPTYVKVCFVLGIVVLIFLFLTAVLFGLFPFLRTREQRLKVKCFAVLSSLIATLFMLINLLVILSYLEHESIEYLIAIERHYRASQIYKLSLDTKAAISRFIASINIEIGYSTRIAWMAFILSIVDGILLMLSCKIIRDQDDIGNRFAGIPSDSSEKHSSIENEEYQVPTTVTALVQNITDSRDSPPRLPTLPPQIVITNVGEQSHTHEHSPPSCLKRSSPPRAHFEDQK